jgi:hypothetical protein
MTAEQHPSSPAGRAPTSTSLSDTFSRTALAFVHDGTATSLDHAQDLLAHAAARITVTPPTRSRPGQSHRCLPEHTHCRRSPPSTPTETLVRSSAAESSN